MPTQIEYILDGPTHLGTSDPGWGFDIRPGLGGEPEWLLNNLHFWPIGNGIDLSHLPRPPIDRGLPPLTLLPAVLTEDWTNSDVLTGINARDDLTHYTQSVANSWEQFSRLPGHQHDYTFLAKQGNTQLTSVQPLEAGSGIALHVNPFGAQLGTTKILTVSFGSSDPAKKYNLNVYSNGRAFLGRGAGLLPADQLANGWIVPQPDSLQGKWLQIFVLPYGRNRMLISSSAGGGFVYEDRTKSRADFSPAQNLPTLVGARLPDTPSTGTTRYPQLTDRATWSVFIYPKVALQPKPLLFVQTGSMTPAGPPVTGGPSYSRQRTPVIFSASSPIVGPDLTKVTADTPRGSASLVSFSAPYGMGNNGFKGLTPTVTLTRPDASPRDHQTTPILYRFEPKANPIALGKTTAGDDVTKDVIRFDRNHDKERSTGGFRLRNAENSPNKKYRRVFNVPFQFKQDGTLYFEGICLTPTWEIDGVNTFLSFELQDFRRKLATVTVKSLGRLDGYGLDDAVKAILMAAGWPADGSKWDIDPVPVFLDGRKGHTLSNGEADDDPTNLADVAKSGEEWLRYIQETYTSAGQPPFYWPIWFEGGKFHMKNPDTFDRTPVWEFFPTRKTAAAAHPEWSRDEINRHVHDKWHDEAIEPECNEILVAGMDGDGRAIFSSDVDKASQNPNTPLDSRPDNWLGEPRSLVIIDSGLNTQALVTAARAKIFRRTSTARIRGSFSALWAPDVKMWSTVRLYQIQDGVLGYNDWMVDQYVPRADRDLDQTVRPTSYSAERWLVAA